MKDENVHAPKFREVKESHANPSAPIADLFRLDGRTVIGMQSVHDDGHQLLLTHTLWKKSPVPVAF